MRMPAESFRKARRLQGLRALAIRRTYLVAGLLLAGAEVGGLSASRCFTRDGAVTRAQPALRRAGPPLARSPRRGGVARGQLTNLRREKGTWDQLTELASLWSLRCRLGFRHVCSRPRRYLTSPTTSSQKSKHLQPCFQIQHFERTPRCVSLQRKAMKSSETRAVCQHLPELGTRRAALCRRLGRPPQCGPATGESCRRASASARRGRRRRCRDPTPQAPIWRSGRTENERRALCTRDGALPPIFHQCVSNNSQAPSRPCPQRPRAATHSAGHGRRLQRTVSSGGFGWSAQCLAGTSLPFLRFTQTTRVVCEPAGGGRERRSGLMRTYVCM